MGTPTTDAKSGHRLLVAALAALAAVTGVTFARVFQGTHPAVRLAAAASMAVAIGALLARRHLVLTLVASGAGLVVCLGILVLPGTTWAGIPTAETIEAILGALGRAGHRAANEIAPAPPLPSLMTAAMIAVWSAAAASHALAVRARATVLPLLPGAALVGFVGVVTDEPPRPGYVVAFLAAAFMVLFAEAVLRNGTWAGGRGRRVVVASRWARSVGVAAIAVALAVPGILPGYDTDAVLRLDGGDARVSVSPIVDIRPNLLRNPPAELFRVEANRPAYWRMAVLDRFDGTVWSSSALSRIEGPLLSGPHLVGSPPRTRDARLEQRFTIQELATAWLPAAPEPSMVDIDGELGARHDVDTGIVALDAPTEAGVEYSVVSSTPTPTAAELDRIDPSEHLRGLQALPPELPYRIRRLASEITSHARTPFRKVLAIQQHLRTFTYDERAPAGHGGHAMVDFLDETRQGYCEQFAGTMAVMVRALGIPARVAIGFLPGERDAVGAYRVTTKDVHAWPEVFFEEFGWLPFEPTPTRSNPNATYLVTAGAVAGTDPPGARRTRDTRAGAREGFQRERDTDGRPDATPEAAGRRRPTSPWRAAALVLAALGVLGASLVPAVKTLRRRLALRHRGDPRRRVVAAYRWMAGGAADLGVRRRRGETLWEYRRRLGRDAGVAPEPLDRLTALTSVALFSMRDVAAEDADDAVAAADAVLRDLRRRAGLARSVAAAIRPGD